MSKQPKPQVVSLDSAREDASYWLKDCIFEKRQAAADPRERRGRYQGDHADGARLR
jgi:hypothetical protein